MTLKKEAYIDSLCETLSPHNQRIIRHFVRNKQLAGASIQTIASEVNAAASFISYYSGKNLDEITSEEIEDWYLWRIKTPSESTGKLLNPNSVGQKVLSVKMLMADIHGKEEAQRMMKNISAKRCTKSTVKEEELLSEAEIQKMIAGCRTERDRAIVSLLYASGCRVGELCNLKIKDVQLHRIGASLHLNGKTGERDIDLFIGVPELKNWLNVHPFRDNPEAPLFIAKSCRGTPKTIHPLVPSSIQKMLSRLAEDVGIPKDKRVNPHSFRHKRATDLADYLTVADLKVMFGWTDMSNTPSIYVHSSRAKVKRKLAEISGIKIPESVAPSIMVRQCPVCGCVNPANAKWCDNCHAVLDERLAREENRVEEFMLADMKK